MAIENPIFRQLANRIAAGENIEKLLEIQRRYALDGARGAMNPEDFQALDRLKIRHMTSHAPPAPDYDSIPDALRMEEDYRADRRRRRSDRRANELESPDSIIFRDDRRPRTPLETHAHSGGTLLPAGSPNATSETARRYPSHSHIVNPTTGNRIGSGYSAPEDGHVVGKEGQLGAKLSPTYDGAVKARRATEDAREERLASRRVKEVTSEWAMRGQETYGVSDSDAYDNKAYVDEFPTVQSLALALQDATAAVAKLQSDKPFFDFRGRHKNLIDAAEDRVRKLQAQKDEKEKEITMNAMATKNQGQPSFFQRIFGGGSSSSPSSTEQPNTTKSASPQSKNGPEMSESDAQAINDYIREGYTYEGVKDGFHVLKKGRDVINITA